MSQGYSEYSESAIWVGKPWILPGVVTRSIVIIAIAIVIFWLGLFFDVATYAILNVPLVLWIVSAFFLVWILSVSRLLLLRASNTYTLRNDSLEIRTGIVASKTFTVVASGFADMEVGQSVAARILNYGDIVIHTQAETNIERRLVNVKNPQDVASRIREVMAKPIVRIEGQ